MEERSSSIEDGAPVISTGATITSSLIPNNLKTKACEMTSTTDASYPVQRTSKRSFDVAFLVAPDEKLIKRQTEKLANLQYCTNRLLNDVMRHQQLQHHPAIIHDDDSREYEQNFGAPQNMTIKHFESIEASKYKSKRPEVPYLKQRRLSPELAPAHLYSRVQKTPSPPEIFSPQTRKLFPDENSSDRTIDLGPRGKNEISGDSRSAFTKVNLAVQRNSLSLGVSPNPSSIGYEDGTASSPRSSVSPDVITYQNSLSPPIVPPATLSPGALNGKFPAKIPPYPFLVTPENPILDNLKLAAATAQQPTPAPPKVPSPNSSKPSGFRPEPVYPNIPFNPLFPPAISDALARPRFLAASLLPSSLAALSLPAQNVCAKCNLSFRMTSDLVYHMRSHHKSETQGESSRRRREEKLRCPVCDESFRERHHLTRHMTAHQDKESDAVVDQVEIKRRSAAAALVHGK